MRKLFLTILILVGSALMLSGYGESYSWNQKLTIEVDTPTGVVSGSAVTHVKIVMKAGLLDAWDGGGSFISGEANVIDLGNGKYLFSLLNNAGSLGGATHWAFYATQIEERKTWPLVGPMIQNANQPYMLKGDNQPMLVTFDDINDPTTIKKVSSNNLAASFGTGYSLKSITLEIIDEKVTQGEVETVLNWLSEYHNTQLDGDRYHSANASNPFANFLNILNFVRK